MNVVLCDDELEEMNKIHQLLQLYPEKLNIFRYTEPEVLLKEIHQLDGNTIFILDIVMPTINGIELGKMIHKLLPEAIIIYHTTSEDYALEAYQLSALQYILKPVQKEVLFNLITRSKQWLSSQKKYYPIETSREIIPVNVQEIYYVEYRNHSLYFHLKDREIMSKSYRSNFSLSASILFEHKNFIQTHRAFLVNEKHISKLNKDHCIMDNQAHVPIARSQMDYVKTRFLDYLLRK